MPENEASTERKAFDYAAAAGTIYDPDAPAPAAPGTEGEPSPEEGTRLSALPAPPAFEPPAPDPAPPDFEAPGEAQEATGATEPPAEPAPQQPTKPKALRFASHEEAERGYANLFAERQRLAEELRQIREGQVQQQKAEYERQVAELRREQLAEFVRERSKQHQQAMAELDPNDGGYDDAVADLEAKYQLDIDSFRSNPPELPADKLPPPPREQTGAAPTDPGDPLADPARYVHGELFRHGIDGKDPFVQHLAQQLPQLGEKLPDGRTVTLPVQMELLVDRLTTETLNHYAKQSAVADLPGLEINHPVLQHYVRQVPATDEQGNPVPFYRRMQQAMRETRRWQAEERRKLLAQQDMPLPASFGPAPARRTENQTRPTSLGSVLDRVAEQSRIR
jgi:hypothetical protein